MLWGHEKIVRQLKAAQYADTLFERTLQILEPVRVASSRILGDYGRQEKFMATVFEQGPRTQQAFRRSPGIHWEESRNESPKSEGSVCLNLSRHCHVSLATSQNMDRCSYTRRWNELAKSK